MKSGLITIVEYIRDGRSLFEQWFDALDPVAAAKITVALYRLEHGNLSNVRSVGKGVLEYKVDYGPGYRVYFGRDGNTLIILLGGGTKKNQNRDIKKVWSAWQDYKTDNKSKSEK